MVDGSGSQIDGAEIAARQDLEGWFRERRVEGYSSPMYRRCLRGGLCEGRLLSIRRVRWKPQQLLFRHSVYGDLTPLIASYFDTRTGPKSESASYAAIAKDRVSIPPK